MLPPPIPRRGAARGAERDLMTRKDIISAYAEADGQDPQGRVQKLSAGHAGDFSCCPLPSNSALRKASLKYIGANTCSG